MIHRTILPAIERSIRFRPVTLITGPRQTGKTTICRQLVREHGFGYVSLADIAERVSAREDPKMFLEMHPAPAIIEDVQFAPVLFDYIKSIVDKAAFEDRDNRGMYILTGNQDFPLMKGVTESLAGRIGIIRILPLSLNEIRGRDEPPFEVDFESNIMRSNTATMSEDEVHDAIVRGFYPRLFSDPDASASGFYSEYVTDFIELDVPEILRVRNQGRFLKFMRVMASMTGRELVYDAVAGAVGADVKTIRAWSSILVSCGIIHLLHPYPDPDARRTQRRPKMYFWDTGLACHLARIPDAGMLSSGYHLEPMVETMIVNEIMKSHINNRIKPDFCYYRDCNGRSVDLVMYGCGTLTLIDCRSGSRYDETDVKAFPGLADAGPSCIVCLTDKAYPIAEGVYALPLTSI